MIKSISNHANNIRRNNQAISPTSSAIDDSKDIQPKSVWKTPSQKSKHIKHKNIHTFFIKDQHKTSL
ncbi:hypothetical protein [Helicobacter cetorum]|uniref:hypothetical protein n=1 Tax=Helicobacter cetorum TaxID=138563 RepID=UPI0013153240|nr:hypothetical protein [Helicobacter cetorum]